MSARMLATKEALPEIQPIPSIHAHTALAAVSGRDTFHGSGTPQRIRALTANGANPTPAATYANQRDRPLPPMSSLPVNRDPNSGQGNPRPVSNNAARSTTSITEVPTDDRQRRRACPT